MALVRMAALKDFRTAALALSTCAAGNSFNLGAATTGQSLYAGLHLTSASLGTTARMLVMAVQSASSSAFGVLTTQATFTLSTGSGAEWATPVLNPSTDQIWWRAVWGLTTANSTGGAWRGLTWMGFR